MTKDYADALALCSAWLADSAVTDDGRATEDVLAALRKRVAERAKT